METATLELEEREVGASFDDSRIQTDDPLYSYYRQKRHYLANEIFSQQIREDSIENHSTSVHEIAMHGLGKVVSQKRGEDGRYYFGDTATVEFTQNGIDAIDQSNLDLAPERVRRQIEHIEEGNITNDLNHFIEMGAGALKAIWSLDASFEKGDMLMDQETRNRLGYEGRAMIRTHRLNEDMSEKIMQSWCVFDLDIETAQAACLELYGEDIEDSASAIMSYFAERLPAEDDQITGSEYIDKVMSAFIKHAADDKTRDSLVRQREVFLDESLQENLERSSRYFAAQLVDFEEELVTSQQQGFATEPVQLFLEEVLGSDRSTVEQRSTIKEAFVATKLEMNDDLLKLAFTKKYYAIQIAAGLSVGNQKTVDEAKTKYGQEFIDSMQDRTLEQARAIGVGDFKIAHMVRLEMDAAILNSSMTCVGGCAMEVTNEKPSAAAAISKGVFNGTRQLYESREADQKVCGCRNSVKVYDGIKGYCTSCNSVSGRGSIDAEKREYFFSAVKDFSKNNTSIGQNVGLELFKQIFLPGWSSDKARKG